MKRTLRQIPIEELRECYVDKRMSAKEIAELFHVDVKSLRLRLKNEGISLRTRSEATYLRNEKPKKQSNSILRPGPALKRPPREVLYELYINQGLSLKQIGLQFDLSHATIHNALRAYGIPVRKLNYDPQDYSRWETGVLWLYNQYKTGAQLRGYSFELNEQQFYTLIKGDCCYCGRHPGKRKGTKLLCNGIDRADNTQGYTIENCRSCCGKCNWMKGSQTEEEFIAWVLQIAEHLKTSSTLCQESHTEGGKCVVL
jgi:hypothetical protein